MVNIKKVINISKKYIKSIFKSSPFFMHIAPTRRCNLGCDYCYQYDNASNEMSFDSFKEIIDNNYKLGLGIVAFTGGEPLIWKHLDEAIDYCNEKNIFTQLTTNGTLLRRDRLDRLKKAGLDYLMVSIDAVKKKPYSKKTVSDNPEIIDLLKHARSEGMVVSWNTVLMRDNYQDVYELIELSNKEKIPISIGIIVSPPNKENKWNGGGLELKDNPDKGLLKKIIERLKDYKDNRYPIIEPKKYFEDIEKYLNGEFIWDCSLAKARTIQVSPESDIYWCSKLNFTSPYKANLLDKGQLNAFREELVGVIKKCNQNCYSNCAYNGYYLQKHKLYFLTNILPLFLQSVFTNGRVSSVSENKSAEGSTWDLDNFIKSRSNIK